MRRFKSHHVKKSSLTFFLLLTVFVATLTMINPVKAQTTILVDPVDNVYDPGESFTVDINIQDVTDLFSYEVQLGFDENVLEATEIKEGPFLKQVASPSSTFFSSTIESDFAYATGVIVWLAPPPRVGISGSGTLFNVTFNVVDSGDSNLHLYETILLDSTGTEISHGTSDGSFHTTTPLASFSFTPKTYGRPIVGEIVTFDGSASYDPDGGYIVSYEWDFDDEGATGTGVIVNHTYTETSPITDPYNVTLTVTDNDGKTDVFFFKSVNEMVHVKFHDIAVIEVNAPDEVLFSEDPPGVARIDVTVLNNGSHNDFFNVTAYYNSNPIQTKKLQDELIPGENATLSFYWNTFINQTIKSPTALVFGTWTDPLFANVSDNSYTHTNTTLAQQAYTGYDFETAGWAGVSKVEVGLEARTDSGGDDQILISIKHGNLWSEPYMFNITSETDSFFWVDVTSSLSWTAAIMNATQVRIEYRQIGDTATPIYVDWLPVRISPTNPVRVAPGPYAIWANAYLVERNPQAPYPFRPGEEENTADNTLFGNSTKVTMLAVHDIAIANVTVSPTNVVLGRASTVRVEVENKGNTPETFDVFVYANSTQPIANQTGITLAAGKAGTYSITWFRTTVETAEGFYNVTVYIPPIVGETNIVDNRQNLTVLMRLLPVATFTVSPTQPLMDEEITFDASESYAPGVPGGTITGFMWDFGDGANSVGAVVTHAYSNPGVFLVKLTVIDDESLNNSMTQSVTVQKLSSTISISASATIVPISLSTTISGSISPIRSGVTVTINYTKVADDATWIGLANVTTDANGQYSFDWAPTEIGSYQFKVFWQGDSITNSAVSSVLDVTVIIRDTAVIDVTLSSIGVNPGESVTIRVRVENKGTATETFDVTVYYNETLLETKQVIDLAADRTETVSFSWNTQDIAEGAYIIKAVSAILEGETYDSDNSRTYGLVIGAIGAGVAPMDIFMYSTIGLAAAVVVLVIYILYARMRKAKG